MTLAIKALSPFYAIDYNDTINIKVISRDDDNSNDDTVNNDESVDENSDENSDEISD